jgi:hypothetical protein
MSYGFGAFLDGLVGGMERRRTWDRQDRTLKWDEEDRQIAREDRTRRIAIEEENAARTRTLWSREDEQYNLDRAARDAEADFFANGGQGGAGAAPAPGGGAATQPRPSPDLAIEVPANTAEIQRSELPPSPAAPAIDTPPQTRPQPRPEGAGRQIAPQAGEAVPGSTPTPGTETAPATAAAGAGQRGYAATLREAGIADSNMLQAAEAADQARTALETGIYPFTNEPLTPEARQQLQGIIAQADQALQATLGEAAAAQQVTGAPQGGPRGAEAQPAPPPSAPQAPPVQAATPAPGNGAPATAATPTGTAQPLNVAPQTAPQVGGGATGTWGAAQAGTPPPAAAAPPADGRVPADAPAPTVEGFVEPSSPEEAQQTEAAAAQAARELPSAQEATEVAQETVRQITVRGQTFTVEDVTEENLEISGTNFQTRYNRDGVDRVVQAYLRAGNREAAESFRQFIQDEETQQSIVHFGRAIFAASAGDADQFLIEMAAIYNTERYYDDGYTVVLDDSEILRDENGNFAGSRIAFRNDESGEVFMREILDEDDFYSLAIGLGAPETVFNNWLQEYSSSREVRAAEAEAFREAMRVQPQTVGERREDFNEIFQFLFEQSEGEGVDVAGNPIEGAPPRFRDLPTQEQVRIVLEMIEAREAGLSGRAISPAAAGAPRGDVPVATTP